MEREYDSKWNHTVNVFISIGILVKYSDGYRMMFMVAENSQKLLLSWRRKRTEIYVIIGNVKFESVYSVFSAITISVGVDVLT